MLSAHVCIELLCLAGFMRLLTPCPFVRSLAETRMINIYPGAAALHSSGLYDPCACAAAGVKVHGATVHFVVVRTWTRGSIISVQGAVAVHEDDTADALAARVLAIEHRIYPAALALVACSRVRIVDGRCVIEGTRAGANHLIVPAI